MQMIDELYLLADRKYNSKLPRHFHFLIDEFYKFRVMEENFIDFLSANRGYNISCTMIIQAYQHLETNYKKEGAQIIEGCCDSYLFLGSNSGSAGGAYRKASRKRNNQYHDLWIFLWWSWQPFIKLSAGEKRVA